jgi:hypothetical protein
VPSSLAAKKIKMVAMIWNSSAGDALLKNVGSARCFYGADHLARTQVTVVTCNCCDHVQGCGR